MITIFRRGLKYLTVLFFLTSKLFAQSEYWPGPKDKTMYGKFFHLGKIIICNKIISASQNYYFISKDTGQTWDKLPPSLFLSNITEWIESTEDAYLVKVTNLGFYLTKDFISFNWLGNYPTHGIIPASTKLISYNKEQIGYKIIRLDNPRITTEKDQVWFISPDRGYSWTNMSGGLLTRSHAYPTGGSIDDPIWSYYHDVCPPLSFVITKQNYFATYYHDFLSPGEDVDLVKYNFNLLKWERIEGTNFYTDIRICGTFFL